MSRFVKPVVVALVVIGLCIQVVRPARTNPVVDPSHAIAAHVAIPDDVHAMLQHSCGDCHSNETVWPWYSNIAPISWMLASHVNGGRSHLNFSDWDSHMAGRTTPPIDEICSMVKSGNMPLPSYLLGHPDKRLSPGQIDSICAWATDAAQRIK